MSFNIRYGTAPDGALSWEYRREGVIECIRRVGPDLLGVQECRAHGQLADLLAALPEYDWFGGPRGGESAAALEMAPVLYRKDRFERIDQGIYWLSKTPDVPGSLGWGAALPRTVTWVRLQGAGRTIRFVNTHFDHASAEARTRSAEILAGWVADLPMGEPVILTGDFNAEKDSRAYKVLTQVFSDPFRDPRWGKRPTEGSFHGFGTVEPPEAIDWVLLLGNWEPGKAWVEDGRIMEGWLSDHHPVCIQVS